MRLELLIYQHRFKSVLIYGVLYSSLSPFKYGKNHVTETNFGVTSFVLTWSIERRSGKVVTLSNCWHCDNGSAMWPFTKHYQVPSVTINDLKSSILPLYLVIYFDRKKDIHYMKLIVDLFTLKKVCRTESFRIELVCHWWHSGGVTQEQYKYYLFWHSRFIIQ